MAGVNPFYPAGPPTPQPTRPLEVLARPQNNLDDVAAYLWSRNCTLPTWQRPLDETAPVFHTAEQETAAATVIQAAARVWIARMDLPRLRAAAEDRRRSAAAIVIEAVARMCLARLELERLRAAEVQRRTDAAVTIYRNTRGWVF